jgi:hypothetical protein
MKIGGNSMQCSRSLNKLKKVTAVATVIATISCLIPQSAQAGIFKASGNSTNTSQFTFDLDDSVQDQAGMDESKGEFPGAIQNFNFAPGGFFENSEFCGNAVCPPGNLTVSKLTADSSGDIPGLSFGLNGLQQIFDSNSPGSSDIDFSKDVLRYDVTFVSTSLEPVLIWFIQSNDSNLINDLSGLSQFNTVKGIFPRDVAVFDNGGFNNGGVSNISLKAPSQEVPEPTATASLVGAGILGAVLRLKRNKRLKKTV